MHSATVCYLALSDILSSVYLLSHLGLVLVLVTFGPYTTFTHIVPFLCDSSCSLVGKVTNLCTKLHLRYSQV